VSEELEAWSPPFPGFFGYYPKSAYPAALTALIETLRIPSAIVAGKKFS